MSLRRQPQQQRSQERLDRILEAAAEVFWEVGYEAATTHAIAAKANTAVGAIYRFFPDKLAIFHALEKQHYDRLAGIQSGLLSAQFINRPLRVLIRDIVETFAQYFQDPAPRVVYIQYFVNPDMFVYFDAEYNAYLDCRLAEVFRMRTPQLSVKKSELIAQVFNQTYRSLLLDAIRNYSSQYDDLNDELQILLFQYLNLYVGDEVRISDSDISPQEKIENLSRLYHLNQRQKHVLIYILQHGVMTIQSFQGLCPQVSRRSLQRDLKRLVENQLLVAEGKTNQQIYRAGHLMTTCDKL